MLVTGVCNIRYLGLYVSGFVVEKAIRIHMEKIGEIGMKIRICLCLGILLVCVGCKASVGSFHDESLNMAVLSDQIDKKLVDKEWKMNPLLTIQSVPEAAMIYGIDEAFCKEVLIRKALSDAVCEEIVVVHVKDDHQNEVISAFQEYQNKRTAAFTRLVNQQAMLQQAEIISCGSYVIFVCSKDKANVLQYMRSLSE